ncbi:MAG TPA: hypothetical protein VL201_01770 [Patescibacteria group bacterium]|jgi:chromosome segregation ATPase|nr:hypothetical protein [Patescibacteria group bacterium]
MKMKQKYGIAILSLISSSFLCAALADLSNGDDLLGGYDQMASAFTQDSQDLTDLLSHFSNIITILNTITQNRQTTFNSYTQQLQNYQNLLAQEQQNLALLQAQGLADQADLQNKIDLANVQGTTQIANLQSSITSLKDAIATLQQNLTTIANLTQSRVDSVNNMLHAYDNFEAVRLPFKDQLDALLQQIRAYIGTTAVADSLLQQ